VPRQIIRIFGRSGRRPLSPVGVCGQSIRQTQLPHGRGHFAPRCKLRREAGFGPLADGEARAIPTPVPIAVALHEINLARFKSGAVPGGSSRAPHESNVEFLGLDPVSRGRFSNAVKTQRCRRFGKNLFLFAALAARIASVGARIILPSQTGLARVRQPNVCRAAALLLIHCSPPLRGNPSCPAPRAPPVPPV